MRALQPIQAVLLDVDGVIVDSPHEQAWREALAGFTEPARLTPSLYQSHVAGRPRLDGATAILVQLGLPAAQATAYAEAKQRRMTDLIAAGSFTAFPDAIRFIRAAIAAGLRVAAASSSKNANTMLRLIPLPDGHTLFDIFDANTSGQDMRHGKPDPEIFLTTAARLALPPAACLVVEDAPAGIRAARAGGMAALGLARTGPSDDLIAAGADLVVASLDDLAIADLPIGRLRPRAPAGSPP
jgi:HAD superfamily hydrolase (TIGR01509 family)